MTPPAKDKFHEDVRAAIEKENWNITHDPYSIPIMRRYIYIDLAAEKVVAAEKENEKIAIEIKSFLNFSQITDLYNALGQFQIYNLALKQIDPERLLYLAIPETVYDWLQDDEFTKDIIIEYKLKIIVFNSDKQQITKWIH